MSQAPYCMSANTVHMGTHSSSSCTPHAHTITQYTKKEQQSHSTQYKKYDEQSHNTHKKRIHTITHSSVQVEQEHWTMSAMGVVHMVQGEEREAEFMELGEFIRLSSIYKMLRKIRIFKCV